MHRRRWPWGVLLLAVLLGSGLGFATRYRKASGPELQAADLEKQSALGRQEALGKQEAFQVVERWLAEARVPRQDMPKAVIAITPLPGGHYLVHMQMVVGEGWFELWREGQRWQVKGVQPPSPGR